MEDRSTKGLTRYYDKLKVISMIKGQCTSDCWGPTQAPPTMSGHTSGLPKASGWPLLEMEYWTHCLIHHHNLCGAGGLFKLRQLQPAKAMAEQPSSLATYWVGHRCPIPTAEILGNGLANAW